MRAIVSKWGNSLGIRIPSGIARDAHLEDGSMVDVRVEGGRLVIEPATSLAALVARITPENLPDSAADDRPRGGQVW